MSAIDWQRTQGVGSGLFCPVESGAGERCRAAAINAGVQPVAVVFDFVGLAFAAGRFVNKL
jgi:hypothetical protein